MHKHISKARKRDAMLRYQNTCTSISPKREAPLQKVPNASTGLAPSSRLREDVHPASRESTIMLSHYEAGPSSPTPAEVGRLGPLLGVARRNAPLPTPMHKHISKAPLPNAQAYLQSAVTKCTSISPMHKHISKAPLPKTHAQAYLQNVRLAYYRRVLRSLCSRLVWLKSMYISQLVFMPKQICTW